MNTHVSFLRGVNMAGHNSISMTLLPDLYSELGFHSPETFIQSGNVLFGTEKAVNKQIITSLIESRINEKFGFDIPVMIRSTNEMKEIVKVNPYLNEEDFDPAKMAVIFLHDVPSADQTCKVEGINFPPDKFTVIGKEIYIYCPNGFGRTKIYTNFFEKKMKVVGTARNWKTFMTILNLMERRGN